VLSHQRSPQTAPPRAAPHQGLAHGVHRPHLPLVLGRPVRRVVRPQPTGIDSGCGITAIRLDALTALGRQRRVGGVGHDDRVAPFLQAPSPLCALGRSLDQETGLRAPGNNGRKPFLLQEVSIR
jgi:hypothetical protein